MEFRYTPPGYSPERGLRLEWEARASIRVDLCHDAIVLRANKAGLRTLAMHLLTLAQEDVPDGNHIHYEAGESLEDQSLNLTLERFTDE